MTRFDWRHTGRFCAAAASMDTANFTYIVCLPYLAMRFDADSLQLGCLASVRNVAYIAACLTLGRLADRLDRRVLMGVGALVAVMVYVVTAYVPVMDARPLVLGISAPMWTLYLSTAVWSLGLSLWWPSLFAWAGDSHHADHLARSTGAINLSWSVGCMVGAPLAGLLYSLNPSAPFALACLPALIAAAILVFSRQEHGQPRPSAKVDLPPGSRRELAAAWLGNLSACCLLGLMLSVFPKLGKTIGVTPVVFGVLGFALGTGRTAVFAAAIWNSRGMNRWIFSTVTLLVAAGMTATVRVAESHLWLGAVFACLGVAMGSAYFRGLYSSLQHEGSRAKKAGAHEAALVTGLLIGSLGGGWMADRWGLRAPYVPVAVFVAIVAAVQAILVLSSRRTASRVAA